jgi:hypothetical protein
MVPPKANINYENDGNEENSDTDDYDAFYNDRSFLNAHKSYIQTDANMQNLIRTSSQSRLNTQPDGFTQPSQFDNSKEVELRAQSENS